MVTTMEKRETLNKNNAVLISYANAFKNDLIEKRRHNQKHFLEWKKLLSGCVFFFISVTPNEFLKRCQ